MARRGPALPELVLTDPERQTLQGLECRRSTAQASALRSRIVLACAEGVSNMDVVRRLGVSPPTVNKWRRRFIEDGLDGLSDEPRPGAPRTVTDGQVEHVVVTTLEQAPPNNDSHWSTLLAVGTTGCGPAPLDLQLSRGRTMAA